MLCSSLVRADYYIVVQANNPQHTLTHTEVVNLYMGRSRAISNGEFALVFDLPRSEAKSQSFYKALTGMNMAKINSYWSRLMFSGQNMPPQPLPNELAMTEIVKRNPSAIGWLSSAPNDEALRTVLIIKETP